MQKIRIGGICAALALILTACGGGGGGGGSTASGPQSSTGGTASGPQSSTVRDYQSADAPKTEEATQLVANAEPAFGSVTQSTNTDSHGVTTDRASASYDGSVLRVTIERQSKSDLVLDTARHRLQEANVIARATGLPAKEFFLLNKGSSSATLAYAGVVEIGDGATDWLAGGYWLHLVGDVAAGTTTSVEAGAFADSPEIQGTPTLPTSGSATYNGAAGGLYAAQYGTDATVARGSLELGEYAGDLTLTADFDAKSVLGNIDNVYLSGVMVEAGTGDVLTVDWTLTDYELALGEARISSDGTFKANKVSLTNTDPLISITSSSGSWGGKFSTSDDSDGNPRMVAGTHAGRARTSGGTEASFVGAFYGLTPAYRGSR